ncbi:3-phosphoshikimate 1-carboxyvinyltransferase [Thermaurantiacus sp.]
MSRETPEPLALVASRPLRGTVSVPGDKSISHRALMLGALAVGRTRITGLLEGEDVLGTAAALRAMGAIISRENPGTWTVDGVGVGGLLQPDAVLEMGNSGTSARLLLGLAATHRITAVFAGDASLSRRPMARVIEPLARMGAVFEASPGGRLPLLVRGRVPAIPIVHRLEVPSAQVKSAILFAGLNAPGATTVIEPVATRDHSERMLAGFGADVVIEPLAEGGRAITIVGEAELRPQVIEVPGDPSSAAFPLVAALLVPESCVRIEAVGLNPTRAGLLQTLAEMGADVQQEKQRSVGGEPVADLLVRASALTAVEPPPERAPSMIDEYPVLFVAAALAKGRSVFRGLAELKVKESDRLRTMAEGLKAAGIGVDLFDDGLAVEGTGGTAPPGGTTVAAWLDHRVAMSFAVLSLVSRKPVRVDDTRPIATSFPGFVSLMERLGAAREAA